MTLENSHEIVNLRLTNFTIEQKMGFLLYSAQIFVQILILLNYTV